MDRLNILQLVLIDPNIVVQFMDDRQGRFVRGLRASLEHAASEFHEPKFSAGLSTSARVHGQMTLVLYRKRTVQRFCRDLRVRFRYSR
jgi:hypothetical protein